jgi:uncharacterized protein YciI
MELERYTFVLLRRPADAPELPDEELEALQQGHLDHLRAMHERGALAVAGPFEGQPDESLRGFCLYRTDVDETRRLAEQDPSVRAGRMEVDVFSWWTAKDAVSFAR